MNLPYQEAEVEARQPADPPQSAEEKGGTSEILPSEPPLVPVSETIAGETVPSRESQETTRVPGDRFSLNSLYVEAIYADRAGNLFQLGVG